MAQKKSTTKTSNKKSKQLKKTPKINKFLIGLMIILIALTGVFWVWGTYAANPATVTQRTFEGCKYQVSYTKTGVHEIDGIKFPVFKVSAKIVQFSTACSKLEFRYTHLFFQTLATPNANVDLGNSFVGYAGDWSKQQLPEVSYDVARWGGKLGIQVKSGNKVSENIVVI